MKDIKPEFHVRQARLSDALKIRRVHVASIRTLCAGDYTPAQIKAWTTRRSTVTLREAMRRSRVLRFVAERKGKIVGFSALWKDEIQAVYVHPRHVRQGVGAALLRAVEKAARSRRVRELRLSSTLTAAPFYRAHGFRGSRTSLFTLGSGVRIPCVKMKKKLTGTRPS